MARTLLILTALFALVAACESESSDPGPEQGVWCRTIDNPAAGAAAFKILILNGKSSYWVFNGTEPAVMDERYEMVVEDGQQYWHTWIGDQEYGNAVDSFVAGQSLVLLDNDGNPLTYVYHRDYLGSFDDAAGFVAAYEISDGLTCGQL